MEQQKHQRRARFETLVREQHDMLLAYLRAHTGQAASADDLFQKTMLEAWTHLDQLDPDRPAGPWLRGIARNMINSQRRDEARHWRRLAGLAAQRLDQHFDHLDAEPQLEFDEVLQALNDCIDRLDAGYRTPLKQSYWEGIAIKDIAIAMGIGLEACKKRIQRGREMLRDCMRGKGLLPPSEGDAR